jgi:hypothetical protein
MSLMHLPLSAIDAEVLDNLILTAAEESRYIEYKRDAYGSADDDRAEFLADISSLANTSGGDLIIGLEAKDGVPIAVRPLQVNIDSEKLRLESMARDGLEPRIGNLQIEKILIANNGYVLLIRVPKSYNGPHRVIFKKKNKFWARSSAGKYEPNVEELRYLFNIAPIISEKIREFRFSRVAKVSSGDGHKNLVDDICLLIHVIPMTAFDFGMDHKISLKEINSRPNDFSPILSSSTNNWLINFDGFIALSNSNPNQDKQRSYVQVYRSGIVEAVASSLSDDDLGINLHKIIGGTIDSCMKYIAALVRYGYESPICVLVSLMGVRGRHFKYQSSEGGWSSTSEPLMEDQLHFDEVILVDIPSTREGYLLAFNGLLDQISNAAGISNYSDL